MLDADKDMLSTVIRNLVNNAIKFTPKTGMIDLFAKNITYESGIMMVEICVKDSGTGIDPDTKSKLFSISESKSTKGTDQEAGTGLGLIICKEFVEKHGGNIWVESDEGKGSAFYFTIPTENHT